MLIISFAQQSGSTPSSTSKRRTGTPSGPASRYVATKPRLSDGPPSLLTPDRFSSPSIQTQLALVFFGILHVPLNVPSLGVSLNEDNVKLDRELVAHGFSNMLAGIFGTVPNYLCYVNTVLFYRVGGGSRLSGVMLAAATAGVMLVGPSVIGYLRECCHLTKVDPIFLADSC